MRRRLLLAAALAALLAAGLAQGGPPGQWTRVTDPSGRNIDQLGLARTGDGVLHVVWTRKSGNNRDLVHSAVAPSGKPAGSPVNIESGWATLDSGPALVVEPGGGLRVFFSGIRSTNTTDPYSVGDLYSSTAGPGGSGWALVSGPVAAHSATYASDQISATFLPDGTPVTAWSSSFNLSTHAGLDPNVANQRWQDSCCAYSTGLATDSATGEAVLAWFSNANSGEGHGVFTQTVLPGAGPVKFLPGSATESRGSAISTDQRIGITGRIGAPGVYVVYGAGYPTWTALMLWQHGPGKATKIWSGTVRHSSIAAAPGGRLWAMWVSSENRIYAARSNPAATKFGAVVAVKAPAKTETVWKIFGEGSRGWLDLLVSASTPGSLAFWHTQVLPGLTLACKSGNVVSCTVSDAGDPVKGAKVKIGGKTLATNAQGKASADLPAGSYKAVASKAGYTSTSTSVKAT